MEKQKKTNAVCGEMFFKKGRILNLIHWLWLWKWHNLTKNFQYLTVSVLGFAQKSEILGILS